MMTEIKYTKYIYLKWEVILKCNISFYERGLGMESFNLKKPMEIDEIVQFMILAKESIILVQVITNT